MPTGTIATSAVHEGAGRFSIEARHIEAGPHDVVLRVLASGICGTDLAITASPPQIESKARVVLGHEIFGIGVESGELEGTHVVVDPNLYCGRCEMCLRHCPTQCLNFEAIGIHYDGGFADFVAVPADRLLRVDEQVDARAGALIEPLGCVLHGLTRVPSLSPGSVAVVLGGGPIGLLFALVLERALGQRVIVSEANPVRRELVRQRLEEAEVTPAEELPAVTAELTAGRGAPLVIDAVGHLLDVATALAERRGTILAFGLRAAASAAPFQQDLTVKELSVVSAFTANGCFPEAIGLIERGIVRYQDVVTATYPVERIEDAFEEARKGRALKVLVVPAD